MAATRKRRTANLHFNAPDRSAVALLLIDVINDLEFEGGEKLAVRSRSVIPAAQRPGELISSPGRAGSTSFFSGLFRPGRADGGLHVLPFLRRRQHCLHPQRLDPELSAPTLGVIEVLILLILDFVIGSL